MSDPIEPDYLVLDNPDNPDEPLAIPFDGTPASAIMANNNADAATLVRDALVAKPPPEEKFQMNAWVSKHVLETRNRLAQEHDWSHVEVTELAFDVLSAFIAAEEGEGPT